MKASFSARISILLVSTVAFVHGAPANQPDVLAIVARRQANFENSAALYISNDSAAGERTLLGMLSNKSDSIGWHHEAGQRLFAMAVYLRENGGGSAADKALTSALRELRTGAALAQAQRKDGMAAACTERIGAIYEYIGDRKNALLAMQQVTQIDPANQNASRAVLRLTEQLNQLGVAATK